MPAREIAPNAPAFCLEIMSSPVSERAVLVTPASVLQRLAPLALGDGVSL